jgi:hypothetical protein
MLDTVINKYEQPTQGSATAAQDEMQRDVRLFNVQEKHHVIYLFFVSDEMLRCQRTRRLSKKRLVQHYC